MCSQRGAKTAKKSKPWPAGRAYPALLVAFGGTAAPLKEGDILLVRFRAVAVHLGAAAARHARCRHEPRRYLFTREIAPG